MAENPRIEELRRRVHADPASIAFAALAEEFRRVGRYDDAVETCRTGLLRHPAYLSARVTLGRALIETGDFSAARQELETVLRSAPENLAAIRGLQQIQERLGHSTQMDPQLADLVKAAPAQSSRAIAVAPSQPSAVAKPSAVAEASTAAKTPAAPKPSFAMPEPSLAAPNPSVAQASKPTAPHPPVELPSLNAGSEASRFFESLDPPRTFPLDDSQETPASDPFAASAPAPTPGPARALSFDLSTALTIQPKAPDSTEAGADLMMAPAAERVAERPAGAMPEPVIEVALNPVPESHADLDLALDLESEAEGEPEPVLGTAPAGPDPELLATLARLERFLGAIESLRA